jgi:hypothetical protein
MTVTMITKIVSAAQGRLRSSVISERSVRRVSMRKTLSTRFTIRMIGLGKHWTENERRLVVQRKWKVNY